MHAVDGKKGAIEKGERLGGIVDVFMHVCTGAIKETSNVQREAERNIRNSLYIKRQYL